MLINSPRILLLNSLSSDTLSRSRLTGVMHSRKSRQTQTVAASLAGLHFLRTWKAAVSRVSEAWEDLLSFKLIPANQ